MLFSDVWVGTLFTFGGAVINRRQRARLGFVLPDIAGTNGMWLVPVVWLGEETVLVQAWALLSDLWCCGLTMRAPIWNTWRQESGRVAMP